MKYKLPKFLTEKYINIGDELNKLFMITMVYSLLSIIFVNHNSKVYIESF